VLGFISAVDGSTQPYGLIVPAGYDPAKPCGWTSRCNGSTGATGMGDSAFLNRQDGGDELTQPAPDVPFIELQPLGRLEKTPIASRAKPTFTKPSKRSAGSSTSIAAGSCCAAARSAAWEPGSWGSNGPIASWPWGRPAGPVDTIEFAASKWPHFVPLDPLTPWQNSAARSRRHRLHRQTRTWCRFVAAMVTRTIIFRRTLLIERAFEKEGIPFVGLVDRGAGHGITPKVMQNNCDCWASARPKASTPNPEHIRFVTWTLKFSRCHWIEILGLEKHYARAEIDARLAKDGSITWPNQRISPVSRSCLWPIWPAARR